MSASVADHGGLPQHTAALASSVEHQGGVRRELKQEPTDTKTGQIKDEQQAAGPPLETSQPDQHQPSSSQAHPLQPPLEGAGSVQQPAAAPPSASDSGQRAPGSVPSTSQAGGSGSQQEAQAGQEGGGASGKQVSTGDIQRVQNYIEKCLQMYLSQKEVIMQLHQQFKIEPCFTQLVWQKLEEQNQEFFKAYYTRLKLKDQIILFNHLLDEQVKMFQRMPRSGQMMPGAPMMQPRPGLAAGFPQQLNRAGGAGQPAQPASVAAVSNGFPAAAGGPPASQPVQMEPDAHQLAMADFPGVGMDAGGADLQGDLGGMAQSLPFSGSEMNLAGMVSLGSPGRGMLGGGADQDLSVIPRNFSLSDLALDQVADADHGLPRNISLSDLPPLDLDSGGEQA